ncbi:GNAT family N-acetyltransferase [Shewanella olleyana]|uniref:GNAT family N-acetyltransferase n=1 Tax=Shewanella olleyana TaxID=135626 RepID=UPI00200BADEE|nr:GNAT family N-acetyltransferase [Shewanella olleyana]MCL1068772.1 GNAT family N-acetyltransferase [Shewanella olleyana]
MAKALPDNIVETERLIIRPFNENDVEAIFKMNSTLEMLTYIPQEPLTDISQAKDVFVDFIQAEYDSRGFARFAVYHKQDDKVIGFCGPKYLPEFDKVELGYRYFPEYWGKGIGTEAAQAVIDILKPMFEIDQVIALILHGNVGSEAVAKRVGMSVLEQGEYQGHKVHVYQKVL